MGGVQRKNKINYQFKKNTSKNKNETEQQKTGLRCTCSRS